MLLCVIPCGKIESLDRGAVNISTSTTKAQAAVERKGIPPKLYRSPEADAAGLAENICPTVTKYFVERYHL